MSKTLVYAPNWLGDAVMAMPALQVWRKWNPGASLTVLTKPGLVSLWLMHPAVDQVLAIKEGFHGTFRTSGMLHKMQFEEAFILPNSFRSALIPGLADIPRRRGFAGQLRSFLLTEHATRRLSSIHPHQSWESADILLGEGWWPGEGLPLPRITIPRKTVADTYRSFRLPPNGLRVAVVPGAARGESKRWPHFAEAAARLAGEIDGLRFLVLGTPKEAALCRQVAGEIGPTAVSLAGRTALQGFAALLSTCRLALCNDSGGMHLASALGVPVVAVYGLTSPETTGPQGSANAIIRPPGITGERAIARSDSEASRILNSISPDQVVAAAGKIIRSPRLGEAVGDQ